MDIELAISLIFLGLSISNLFLVIFHLIEPWLDKKLKETGRIKDAF